MIIDRFFNPENNSYLVASEIVNFLSSKKQIKISDFFQICSFRYPNLQNNYLIEALGLLYLTGVLDIDKEKDLIGLSK